MSESCDGTASEGHKSFSRSKATNRAHVVVVVHNQSQSAYASSNIFYHFSKKKKKIVTMRDHSPTAPHGVMMGNCCIPHIGDLSEEKLDAASPSRRDVSIFETPLVSHLIRTTRTVVSLTDDDCDHDGKWRKCRSVGSDGRVAAM